MNCISLLIIILYLYSFNPTPFIILILYLSSIMGIFKCIEWSFHFRSLLFLKMSSLFCLLSLFIYNSIEKINHFVCFSVLFLHFFLCYQAFLWLISTRWVNVFLKRRFRRSSWFKKLPNWTTLLAHKRVTFFC